MFYKITDTNLRSLVENDFVVQYSTEHFCFPLVGKLFVFQTFIDVFNFCNRFMLNRLHHPIWNCEVTNPQSIDFMCSSSFGYERFWASFPDNLSGNGNLSVPQGTLVVSSVKLLQRIC